MKQLILLLLTLPIACHAKSAAATPKEPEIKRREIKAGAAAAAARPVPPPLPLWPGAKGATHKPKYAAFKPLPATPTFTKMLEEAIKSKNFDRVIEHLKKQPQDIDTLSHQGRTTLMLLIAHLNQLAPAQQKQLVTNLLPFIAQAKSINYRSPQGFTALMPAISYQIPELVAALITHGADVNLGMHDQTPLMEAMAGSQNHEIVKLLLNNGADVNARNDKGFEAINWAIRWMKHPIPYEFKTPGPKHQVATVELLLKHGADLEARINNGLTLLMSAVNRCNIPLTKFLLDQGADPEVTTPVHGRTALLMAVENRAYMHNEPVLDQHGKPQPMSPADVAENKKTLLQIIQLLLDHRANANAITPDGHSALSLAAFAYDLPVVKELILHGAIDFVTPGQYTILEMLQKNEGRAGPALSEIIRILRNPQAFIKEHKAQMAEAREAEYALKDIVALPPEVTQAIQEHTQGPRVREHETPEHVTTLNQVKSLLAQAHSPAKIMALNDIVRKSNEAALTDEDRNNIVQLAVHYYEHDDDGFTALRTIVNGFFVRDRDMLLNLLTHTNIQGLTALGLAQHLENKERANLQAHPRDATIAARIQRLAEIQKFLQIKLNHAEQNKKGL